MATNTAVASCAATTCAFNDHGCNAIAVTIGGAGTQASCSTFIALDARAGLPVADGKVGACQRLECVHNEDLLCTAPEVAIAGDTAACMSFEAR